MRQTAFIAMLAVGLLQASTTVASADWAIAVGQDGHEQYAYGTAYNYNNTSEARQKAMSNCRSEGRNCEIVADGAGLCAAVAFSTTNNGYGWASDHSKREAVREALRKCYQFAKTECEVRDSFCDD